MVEFLVRRAFVSAVTLLLITVIVFTGVRMIPGDPARVLGGTDKIIMDSKSSQGVVPYLPLDKLRSKAAAGGN